LSGNKNPIQAIASTVSYLERYTLLAITGLTTKDMDDDGKNAGGAIGLYEQWEIKLEKAGAVARSVDEIATWWKTNSLTIKKELSKADAAKIYEKVKVYSKKLSVPEREPGQEG